MWNLTKTFLGNEEQNVIIKVDPQWGFAEFPAFGDVKKHNLPVLIDPEDTIESVVEEAPKERGKEKRLKEFWMPDKYCKVCYGCEEAFTMYRRRHHCRLCGQVFCNNCSSYFIEGSLLNMQGSVRACRPCYEQAAEQAEKETKSNKRKVEKPMESRKPVVEVPSESSKNMQNLQNRASAHLIGIVDRLVDGSEVTSNRSEWKEIIVNLVKEVVSSVDPDVRAGDSLDIRPYVKIKVIPGGPMSECVYIDGVVFRKNVAHKKMTSGNLKENPRILLIASGVEFQRTDMKLSSMDTLIEQEDKFMEILVQKLMSLQPDIILVGKAVARKAQELLCEHKVTVMQNVKIQLLERVARMTGAVLLPSTDNMRQNGEECLGTCGQFWLRLVQDDPEKDSSVQPRRVLRTRVSRGSTYAYVQGCPSERGCTIVLRGGDRHELSQVKQILSFAIVVAYHLRLEVAYYHDRFADLPSIPDSAGYDDSSDIDDEVVDENTPNLKLSEASVAEFVEATPIAKKRSERQLLSTSLDVDFNVPFGRELIGTQLFRSKHMAKFQVESHQTLLITSLLMAEGNTQKSPADVKGIKYYTKHDIALGQFIVENCFQFSRQGHKEPRMLDQTLSFVHRPGRIDITVRKSGIAPVPSADEPLRDPQHAPLYLSSYCKECQRVVTPQRVLSDESWKMSFGKFLEICFYNRSARCQVNGCYHSLRDSHVLSLTCENYVASFEFVPIHAYALHVRDHMSFPEEIHTQQALALLAQLPTKHAILMEDFRLAMMELESEIKDILAGRTEDLLLAMADVRMMETELHALSISFLEDLLRTYECMPIRDKEEGVVRSMLTEKLSRAAFKEVANSEDGAGATATAIAVPEEVVEGEASIIKKERESVQVRPFEEQSEVGEKDVFVDVALAEVDPLVARLFPATLLRNTCMRALRWNTRIDTIYRFLESVRDMLLQQQLQHAQHPLTATSVAVEDDDYLSSKRPPVDPLHDRVEELGTASPPRITDTTSPSMASKEISASAVSTDAVPAVARGVPAESSQPLMSSLYRTAIEQNRRTAEKPVDKMSRITKALSKFLAGNKENNTDEQQRFTVPLGDFGSGRFNLKPGRNGEVIAVSEDELSSVIAYSLCSTEYYEGLQASIHDIDVDIEQDMDAAAPFSDKTPVPVATASTEQRTISVENAMNLLPFKKRRQTAKADANLSTIPEGQGEEHDLDNEEEDPSVPRQGLPKTPSTYGLGTFMEGFSNHEDGSNMERDAFGGNGLFANDLSGEAPLAADQPVAMPVKAARSGSVIATPEVAAPTAVPASPTMRADTGSERKPAEPTAEINPNEKQMISQDKSNIRIRFDDIDDQGNLVCKFQCQIYWAKQFEAVRACYFEDADCHENFIRSLAMTNRWVAQGGKSGAAFAKTSDERLVIKVISRVELQMFLDFAPAYFEYMAKAYYHNLPTVLCKILGIYTVRFDNKDTGKKTTENVVVMENIFYQRSISRTFDLKGSSRARYVELVGQKVDSIDDLLVKRRRARRILKFRSSTMTSDPESEGAPRATSTAPEGDHSELRATLDSVLKIPQVLLDDNLMEFTKGKPFPLKHRAKMFFLKAVQNDTLFLSIVNVVDYSILVGFDDKNHELTVGIIDYLRQYDIIKKMERVGKGSVGMLTGQAEPTIIQPSQYRKRFSAAMERYFMTVPDKWISYDA